MTATMDIIRPSHVQVTCVPIGALRPRIIRRDMQIDGVRREDRLLLCCARTSLDEDARECACRAAAARTSIGSTSPACRSAPGHPAGPAQPAESFQSTIPAAVSADLARHSGFIARRNLILAGRLVELIKTLGERQIRAIPYKGIAVAALACGSITLRQFWDLDILVSPGDYRSSPSPARGRRRLSPARRPRLGVLPCRWDWIRFTSTCIATSLRMSTRAISASIISGIGARRRRRAGSARSALRTCSSCSLFSCARTPGRRKTSAWSSSATWPSCCESIRRSTGTTVNRAATRLGCQRALGSAWLQRTVARRTG